MFHVEGMNMYRVDISMIFNIIFNFVWSFELQIKIVHLYHWYAQTIPGILAKNIESKMVKYASSFVFYFHISNVIRFDMLEKSEIQIHTQTRWYNTHDAIKRLMVHFNENNLNIFCLKRNKLNLMKTVKIGKRNFDYDSNFFLLW